MFVSPQICACIGQELYRTTFTYGLWFVTVLFNWLGGLQIQSRDPVREGAWDYVKPLPGHAIINLGDAMVTFTNGLLKSAKHRVMPAPGQQVEVDRYSLVYFARPRIPPSWSHWENLRM